MAPLPADFGLRRGSKRRWGFLRPADLNFSIFFERVRPVVPSPATGRASGVIGKKLKAAEWGNPRREILVEYSYGVVATFAAAYMYIISSSIIAGA